jgi:hypothetical protein
MCRLSTEEQERRQPPSVVTIVSARYGGIYEPGKWLAFPCSPEAMPEEWNADDGTCMEFWRTRRHEVGGGETPDEALADLRRKQQANGC